MLPWANRHALFFSTVEDSTPGLDVDLRALENAKADTITLKGQFLGKVAAKAERWELVSSQAFDSLLSWMSFVINGLKDRPILTLPPESLLANLFANLFQADDSISERRRQLLAVMRWLTAEDGSHKVTAFFKCKDLVDFLDVATERFIRSVLFQTTTGDFGISRGLIEIGDVVMLLAKSRIPIILRQQGESWLYIGPAHVSNWENDGGGLQDTNANHVEDHGWVYIHPTSVSSWKNDASGHQDTNASNSGPENVSSLENNRGRLEDTNSNYMEMFILV